MKDPEDFHSRFRPGMLIRCNGGKGARRRCYDADKCLRVALVLKVPTDPSDGYDIEGCGCHCRVALSPDRWDVVSEVPSS